MVNIDWNQLGFAFMPTKSNIRFEYRDGKWSEGKLYNDYNVTMSVASNCLHYGQAAFEGMKAFRCKDGKVRVFRPEENARRLNSTCRHILMPEVPEELFIDGVLKVVRDNEEFVPPYGTGGTLYIRPVIFGTTPQIGVSPSKEYTLVIMVVPVGAYYKGGIKPVDAMISDELDRAAPHGTGTVKVAGNYAASLYSSKLAKEQGCSVALFLDPATHTYIDEFGTSNFFGITPDGKYVTPKSDSILPSITNKSLMQVAADLGMTVECRPVHKDELKTFTEVGACGTAVVITPVHRIYYRDQVFTYGETIGPVLEKLYYEMTGIQFGEKPDTHNWLMEI